MSQYWQWRLVASDYQIFKKSFCSDSEESIDELGEKSWQITLMNAFWMLAIWMKTGRQFICLYLLGEFRGMEEDLELSARLLRTSQTESYMA